MARNMYGATSADFTLTAGGRVVPGATLTVWSARTGGTQVTDLLDVNSVACTTVTSGADGSVVFYGPNNEKATLWLDSGQGSRIAVRPVDLTGETGPTPDLTIGTVTTGTAGATLTGTDEDPVLNLVLPSAGANGVNTAAIQAKAVTAAKIADDTITAGQIAPNAVGSSELADGAVTPVKTIGVVQAKTANYTILTSDSVVTADTTSGAVTLTLPAANAMTGRSLRIIKTAGANTLTVQRAGSDTIIPSSGSRTSVAFPAGATFGEMELVSNGTAWYALGGQASDETVGSRLWKWEQALAATSTTAATGWQLVYADTGWRDVSALVNGTGWTVAGGQKVCVRREANRVTLAYAVVATATPTADVITFPAGFTPDTGKVAPGYVFVRGSASATARQTRISVNDFQIQGSPAAGDGIFSGQITFISSGAWPSSLPGVAA